MTVPDPQTPTPIQWIVDLYPGQERWGRITEEDVDFANGFVTVTWCTGRSTRIRSNSVKWIGDRRSGQRGYYRAENAQPLVALLRERTGGKRQQRADELESEAGR